MTNMNPVTGVRYTTFYLNKEIDPDVGNDLFYEGCNVSYEEAFKELKDEVEGEVAEEVAAGTLDAEDAEDEVEYRVEARAEHIQIDEPNIEGEADGVKYAISWLGGAPLLWVFESPYKGAYRLCSPCVPGACDGSAPDPDGYEGYDVPPDWKVKEFLPDPPEVVEVSL